MTSDQDMDRLHVFLQGFVRAVHDLGYTSEQVAGALVSGGIDLALRSRSPTEMDCLLVEMLALRVQTAARAAAQG